MRIAFGIEDTLNVQDNYAYPVEPHQLTSLQNFQAYFYVRGKAYRGHIYTVPSDFEIGKDIPYLRIKPTIKKRKWHKTTGKAFK